MSDAYRDPLASLRAQVETKREVVHDLDRRLTPLRRRVLDARTLGALSIGGPPSVGVGPSSATVAYGPRWHGSAEDLHLEIPLALFAALFRPIRQF